MIDYGKQRSTVEPLELELTETRVFVSSNIIPVNEPGTEEQPGFVGWEFDLIEYTKDEYSKFRLKRMQHWNSRSLTHSLRCVKFMN